MFSASVRNGAIRTYRGTFRPIILPGRHDVFRTKGRRYSGGKTQKIVYHTHPSNCRFYGEDKVLDLNLPAHPHDEWRHFGYESVDKDIEINPPSSYDGYLDGCMFRCRYEAFVIRDVYSETNAITKGVVRASNFESGVHQGNPIIPVIRLERKEAGPDLRKRKGDLHTFITWAREDDVLTKVLKII